MSDIGNKCVLLQSIGEMEEVIINILSKLPVKKAVACKCVAKHWCNLISEPSFPPLQLSWSMKKPKYIICPYPEVCCTSRHLCLMEENGIISENVPVFGFEEICSPEFVCFLNGLVCIVNEVSTCLNEVDVTIMNPVTRDTIELPRGSTSTQVPTVGVAFDPKSQAFKAFRFFSTTPKGEVPKFKCEVYTSGSTGWRIISEENSRPVRSELHLYCPFYASIAGAVYWFKLSEGQAGIPVSIHSVDMDDNFAEINLPTRLHEWSFLIELEGSLSVVHVNNPPHPLRQSEDSISHLEVYIFKDSQWRLRSKAVMDLLDVYSFNSVAARASEIFFILKHADESNCFLIYDLDSGSFKNLDLEDEFLDSDPVAFPFIESLIKCNRTVEETVSGTQLQPLSSFRSTVE